MFKLIIFQEDFEEKNAQVKVANNEVEMTAKLGKYKEEDIKFRDVLYIIVESDFDVIFNKKCCKVLSNITTGVLMNGMFNLNIASNKVLISEVKSNECNLWHKRVGHVNDEILRTMNADAVVDVKCDVSKDKCITCLKGKLIRSPFKDCETRSTEILRLIHSDTWFKIHVNFY